MSDTYTPVISKITLPSGNSYWLKDQEARELIAKLEGGSYFLGVTTTPLFDGCDDPEITINGQSVSAVNGNMVIYGYKEYVWGGTAATPSVGRWYEFGDLSALGDLAHHDNVTLDKTKDTVLGEATTFTNASSSVQFAQHTTQQVLGVGTTFTVTQPTITVTPTTTNIQATASGTAVEITNTVQAVTGFNALQSLQFVRSVSAESNKNLVTASIVPTNGTETVSKVTNTTKHLQTTTIPNVTSVGTASSWSFAMGTGSGEGETLIISGANSSTPTLGSDITAATGQLTTENDGASVVDTVTISDKDVAKVGTAVTVATGATSADGTGAAVVTGITIGEQAEAIVGLGAASTEAVATGIGVSTQPTIALATGATAGAGVISVATGITSATATDGAVEADTNATVNPITVLGAATAEPQTITVGTNDKVDIATYDSLQLHVIDTRSH